MGQRAEDLAKKFEQANADAIATIEKLSDADWKKTTLEGWTVAACAHHISSSHEAIAGWVQGIGAGQAPPAMGLDDFHEPNAKHAREYANAAKADVLAQLKSGGAAAAATVRGLSDQALDA